MSCCGEPMTRLEANTSEGASEKHLPVVKKEGDKIHVQVGSVSHPMSEEHSIQWIYLATRRGGQIKQLESHQPPEACFSASPHTPETVRHTLRSPGRNAPPPNISGTG